MTGTRKALLLGAFLAVGGLTAQPAAASTSPTPVITSLSVTSGPTTGANTVVITGSGFTGMREVDFGEMPATVIGTHTGTKITVEAPSEGEGDVFVTVLGKVFRSLTGNVVRYSYLQPPHVSGVSPSSLPLSGGTVTIAGDHFTNLLAVYAHNDITGVNTAVNVTSASATRIVTVLPPGTGTVEMQVKTLVATSALDGVDSVLFIPAPQITTVYPASDPTAGNTWVLLHGTGFAGRVTSVTFGSVSAPFVVFCPYPATCPPSEPWILTVAPPGNGLVNVQLHGPYGDSAITGADQYWYGPPSVLLVTPSSGSNTLRPLVYIVGYHFLSASAVHFGATAVSTANWSVVNDNVIKVLAAPTGSGTVDVTVTAPGGTSAIVATDRYTYTP